MDTDHDCSYKRVTNWKHQNANSINPAAQTMIYVITWNRIARKLTDIEFLNLSQYVPRNAYVHFPEILGTCYATYGANMYLLLEAPDSSPGTNTMF